MQPLSYYYVNVLEAMEKPCDVPAAERQEGFDLLYQQGGRVEIDLMQQAEQALAEGAPFHWHEAIDAEQQAKLRRALEDQDPAKIHKLLHRNGYASILYHHARTHFPAVPGAA
ncbi:hypothetical protein [Halomonas sp. YLGW01]|uniref:hypothetical protein n=1 Tax=Halomonas sp. YLGW01 TaxID=2773308 RepID=UPI00177FF275|nr:hypothetical protein [Halomonas sp. YLGW01]